MTIPLDKLYHYIESVAETAHGGDVIIYRFYPHGSKKFEDLRASRDRTVLDRYICPPIYCNDQEPLDYEFYKIANKNSTPVGRRILLNKFVINYVNRHLFKYSTIYDKCLVLHSEKRSKDVELYQNDRSITVYYWSHGLIALDWFRYAKYEKVKKNPTHTFLIYNRAWSNTREYRLKFIDLLIKYNLIDKCRTTFNPIEPELKVHYTQYTFKNKKFAPVNLLENLLPVNSVESTASADYVVEDYNTTEIEVVLETLFDDNRLHLTEKILRPIALGQPFILAATCGSLEYLRSYGFKTFSEVINESYDKVKDPLERLEAIVSTMNEISLWSDCERTDKMCLLNQIAEYNRKHFFSSNFFNQITNELEANLRDALAELERTNTSTHFINFQKGICKFEEIKNHMLNIDTRQNIVKILTKARSYYNKKHK